MKKQILLIVIFTSMILIISHFSSVYSMSTFKELEDIKKIAEINNVEIKKWKVYIKETQSKESLQKVKAELGEIFNKGNEYSWNEDKDEHHYQATGVIQKGNSIEKVIISVLPSKQGYSMVYSYELMVEGAIDLSNQTNIPFEFKNLNKFLTVEGITTEGINNSVLSKRILDFVEGTKVEELIEKDFISVSGLSEKWKTHLKLTKGNLMNIQIGIRNIDDKSKRITIGTPIIITEY